MSKGPTRPVHMQIGYLLLGLVRRHPGISVKKASQRISDAREMHGLRRPVSGHAQSIVAAMWDIPVVAYRGDSELNVSLAGVGLRPTDRLFLGVPRGRRFEDDKATWRPPSPQDLRSAIRVLDYFSMYAELNGLQVRIAGMGKPPDPEQG